MRRLNLLLSTCALFVFMGCKQTAEDRYQRYLEEVADSSGIEFITPEKDPVDYVDDDMEDPFANDKGIVTIPDIPQERRVDMNSSDYDVEKMMMGKE